MKPPKCRTCGKEEYGHICKRVSKAPAKKMTGAISVRDNPRAPARKKGKRQ